jgi:hypothetical protein
MPTTRATTTTMATLEAKTQLSHITVPSVAHIMSRLLDKIKLVN